jgi:hypothetical protein
MISEAAPKHSRLATSFSSPRSTVQEHALATQMLMNRKRHCVLDGEEDADVPEAEAL